MLVRSASTPVLDALLPPGCQSPAVSSPAVHFAKSPASAYHLPAISCHLAGPGSRSNDERSRGAGSGMRRTSSEGNLASLAGRADDHHVPLPSRPRLVPLETIQSFTDRRASIYDEEDEDDDFEAAEHELSLGQFNSFVGGGGRTGSTYSQEHLVFLARGLGIDRLGSGLLGADSGGGFGGSDGGDSNLVTSGNDGDRSGIEMHYKKMIEEDPCNGLFLRYYVQFLYQVKGITGGQRSTTPERSSPNPTTEEGEVCCNEGYDKYHERKLRT